MFIIDEGEGNMDQRTDPRIAQKLVDLTFSISLVIWESIFIPARRSTFHEMSKEQFMAWVANQLRECGFDTEPIGMSWGVLKDETPVILGNITEEDWLKLMELGRKYRPEIHWVPK